MDMPDISAAFIIGALTGTGVGGGGLLVLYLTLLRGIGQTKAQWMNLLLFVSVSATAVPFHLSHRKTDPGLIALFIALALPGTLAGSAIRGALPEGAVRTVFGFAMLVTGSFLLFKKEGEPVRPERRLRQEGYPRRRS